MNICSWLGCQTAIFWSIIFIYASAYGQSFSSDTIYSKNLTPVNSNTHSLMIKNETRTFLLLDSLIFGISPTDTFVGGIEFNKINVRFKWESQSVNSSCRSDIEILASNGNRIMCSFVIPPGDTLKFYDFMPWQCCPLAKTGIKIFHTDTTVLNLKLKFRDLNTVAPYIERFVFIKWIYESPTSIGKIPYVLNKYDSGKKRRIDGKYSKMATQYLFPNIPESRKR